MLGRKVTSARLKFVSFKPYNDKFIGYLSLQDVLCDQEDTEVLLHNASCTYTRFIVEMRLIIRAIRKEKSLHKSVAARTVWKLGDRVFALQEELSRLSLQLDGIYGHLERDLLAKRKWLEKVLIFRRYIPSEALIPETLSWWRCERGTRQVAERLVQGKGST